MSKEVTKESLYTYYLISFILSIFINQKLFYFDNILLNNLTFTWILTSFIFFLTYYHNNPECVDFEWGTLGIGLLLINLHRIHPVIIKLIYFFPALLLILIYSCRHIYIYIRHFRGLKRENLNFRYKDMENSFGNKRLQYWIFSYFNLHLVPLTALALVYHPIFEAIVLLFEYKYTVKYFLLILGYMIGFTGILLTSVADEHLYMFKKNKRGGVISNGLWGVVRHPNYSGEILYYFGLFVVNFSFIMRIGSNVLGFVLMTCIFVFYSTPAMEEHLIQNYGDEYKEYMKTTRYKLFPYLL
jgi:steroid 5-alpha reductase family enzyme